MPRGQSCRYLEIFNGGVVVDWGRNGLTNDDIGLSCCRCKDVEVIVVAFDDRDVGVA